MVEALETAPTSCSRSRDLLLELGHHYTVASTTFGAVALPGLPVMARLIRVEAKRGSLGRTVT